MITNRIDRTKENRTPDKISDQDITITMGSKINTNTMIIELNIINNIITLEKLRSRKTFRKSIGSLCSGSYRHQVL